MYESSSDEEEVLLMLAAQDDERRKKFLATGDSFSTIGHSYRVSFSTVGVIVQEVCQAIINKMQGMYMPEPTKEIWKKSAKGFYDVWKFPNCIGSIDGKHITIKCPKNTGSIFVILKSFPLY
nr:unnamed protein product [Callosobruchus analis]